MTRLEIVPMTITDAKAWVEKIHRHHRAPVGGLFAIGLARESEIVSRHHRATGSERESGWMDCGGHSIGGHRRNQQRVQQVVRRVLACNSCHGLQKTHHIYALV